MLYVSGISKKRILCFLGMGVAGETAFFPLLNIIRSSASLELIVLCLSVLISKMWVGPLLGFVFQGLRDLIRIKYLKQCFPHCHNMFAVKNVGIQVRWMFL